MPISQIFNQKKIYSIIEPLILIIAITLVNFNFFPSDIGFTQFIFHPFWLVIIFFTPRQKIFSGIATSALTAVFYLALTYYSSSGNIDARHFSHAVLFIIIGYFLSLVRENYDRNILELTQKNIALEKQIDEIREINLGISTDDRKNALRIFEASNTIKTVYNAASGLGSFDEGELMGSLCDLIKKFTNSGSFAIYKIIEGENLIIAGEYCCENIEVICNIIDDPLVSESYATGKIYTVLDLIDKNTKRTVKSPVKISCPIKFKDTNKIYGFIVIYELEFSKMNLELINILELVVDWTQSALVKSRQMSEAKSRAIEDDLTMAYKYDYFKKRASEEYKRAKRYNFDLASLMVKIINYENIAGTRRPEILRLLSIFLKTIVRDVDMVSRFKDENLLICLLPSTDEKGVMILIRRLQEALPAFLKNSRLSSDTLKLDYNYKVLYRKQ